jgi:hypothetical protein
MSPKSTDRRKRGKIVLALVVNLILPSCSQADVVLPLATKKKFFGSLALRYMWDVGVESNTRGQTFLLMATFPIPSVPLQ